MWRIAVAVLLIGSRAALAQTNCDPNAGIVDASCLEPRPDAETETPSKARTPKAAILEYFSGYRRPRIEKTATSVALEVCFDTCDYYRGTAVNKESNLWDAAFLHQYYFNGVELPKFRERYASIASATLKRHSAGCQGESEEALAKCVVEKLARSLNLSYWFVRYDEGHRCEARGRLTAPGLNGKTSCRKVSQGDL